VEIAASRRARGSPPSTEEAWEIAATGALQAGSTTLLARREKGVIGDLGHGQAVVVWEYPYFEFIDPMNEGGGSARQWPPLTPKTEHFVIAVLPCFSRPDRKNGNHRKSEIGNRKKREGGNAARKPPFSN
jgi:hypothetical protein